MITGFSSLIETAPEDSEQSVEGVIIPLQRHSEASVLRCLSQRAGWPQKCREAVQTPPHGEGWASAFNTARDVCRKSGILIFYGIRGSGKTRMAAELAMLAGSSRYRTAMRFFLEIRATFKANSEKTELDIIDDLAAADLLVLDEIQERGETAFEDRLLTHLIDARYSACKPTVIITNLQKAALAASLGQSIVDRVRENGKSIEFNWPSYRNPAMEKACEAARIKTGLEPQKQTTP